MFRQNRVNVNGGDWIEVTLCNRGKYDGSRENRGLGREQCEEGSTEKITAEDTFGIEAHDTRIVRDVRKGACILGVPQCAPFSGIQAGQCWKQQSSTAATTVGRQSNRDERAGKAQGNAESRELNGTK